MDLLAFILGRSGPFFDFLVKSPLNLSGLNINVCPHYSHQLSKQESFKVVDSLVVFRCFIIFMGGSFSKHWFMGGLGCLIGKQLLGGCFLVWCLYTLEQQHFPHWYRWDSGVVFFSQKMHVWKVRFQGISSA